MSVYLNSLPDDCLLPIFDRVPLLDLLRLNRVCPRWKCLLPSACARRNTLALIFDRRPLAELAQRFRIPFNNSFDVTFDGRQPYFDFPVHERQNSMTFVTLIHPNPSLNSHLTNLIPNVHNLVVIYPECCVEELNSLVDLLRFWTSLKSLKLWIRTHYIDIEYFKQLDRHPVRHLLESINRQRSLNQLTLEIDGDRLGVNFPLDSYSFVGRLKVVKLHLGNYGYDSLCWEIVNRFDSGELRNVGLWKDDYMEKAALNPKFEFTPKVSQFYGYWVFDSFEEFGHFCWRFPFLTMLDMVWSSDSFTFTQLVRNLSSLRQLTYLQLDIELEDNEDHSENPFALDDDCVDGCEEAERSLPQVKILELTIDSKRSHDLEFDSLSPLVFPSVEVIILRDAPSEIILRSFYCDNTEYEKRANQCHRQLVLNLKNKFAANSVRLYATRCTAGHKFVDWTSNYVRTEDDDVEEDKEEDDEEEEEEEEEDDDDLSEIDEDVEEEEDNDDEVEAEVHSQTNRWFGDFQWCVIM